MSSNSRRVRSTERPCDERLELVGADLELARDDRLGGRGARAQAAAAHDGLDARDDLFGMAGLGDPVVGAHPQPADALGDRRVAGADDDAAARAGRVHTRSSSSQACGPSIARSMTSAPSRIATRSSLRTALARTRCSHPSRSSRLVSTWRKPESRSSTAIAQRRLRGDVVRSAHLAGV